MNAFPRGAPPLPLPLDPQTAGVTSRHSGDRLDLIRTAILALQHYAEQEDDDVELAQVHKCVVALQNLLANHAKNRSGSTSPAGSGSRRRSSSPGVGFTWNTCMRPASAGSCLLSANRSGFWDILLPVIPGRRGES